jgi:hypothetical protein
VSRFQLVVIVYPYKVPDLLASYCPRAPQLSDSSSDIIEPPALDHVQVEPDDVLALAMAVRLAANAAFPYSAHEAQTPASLAGLVKTVPVGGLTAAANTAVGCLPCGAGVGGALAFAVESNVGERAVEVVAARAAGPGAGTTAEDPGAQALAKAESSSSNDIVVTVVNVTTMAVGVVAGYLRGIHVWT